MMRRLACFAVLAALVLCLAGCASGAAATSHDAATTVARLLELRSHDSTDVAAYEPLFSDTSLATQLAESSDGTSPSVPEWRAPSVSRLTSGSADVVVRWRTDTARFPDWPTASVFVLDRADGGWVVVDVVDSTGAVSPPLGDAALRGVSNETVEK